MKSFSLPECNHGFARQAILLVELNFWLLSIGIREDFDLSVDAARLGRKDDILEEYTKLSIHNHFGGKSANLTIDRPIGDRAVFDLAKGFEELRSAKEAGYQLLAQTNSNHLDVAAYLLMRKMASLDLVELLPGVEINLVNWKNEKQVLHVVVVVDPCSNLFVFTKALEEAFAANNRFALQLEQFCEILSDRRAIICVHGLKQDDRGLAGNSQMAQELLSMNRYFPVAVEDNRSFHKLSLQQQIKEFLSDETLVWFDTVADISSVDRQNFDKVLSPTYMWAGATFDDLFYSVLAGDCRMVRKEDIVKRVSYVARIAIDAGNGMTQSDVNCSQGLNCVIGPSGSGKTLLMDILKMKLKGNHLTAGTSNIGDYSGLYDLSQVHLYGSDGKEIVEADHFEVIEGENLYNKVIKAYSTEKGELVKDMGLGIDSRGFTDLVARFSADMNRYLRGMAKADEYRTVATGALAQAKSAALFIAANDVKSADTIDYNQDPGDGSAVAELDEKIAACADGAKKAKEHFDGLIAIADKNDLSEGLKKQLIRLRGEFLAELAIKKLALEASRFSKQFDKDKGRLIYEAVQAYNAKVSGQYHQVNKQRQVLIDKLSDLAVGLMAAKKAELTLEVPTLSYTEVRGSIGLASKSDIARLSIQDINLGIGDEGRLRDIFHNDVRVRASAGKAKSSAFVFPIDLASETSVRSMLDVFFRSGVKDGLSMALPLDGVATYSIELKDENGNYRPIEEYSAGMLSKIYVTYFLDRTIQNEGSNTILLYDQPESNMEKEFLLRTLGKKLKELRRVHQIFVATHEPLLVVNADANEIILATNDKRVDEANCVTYENRSFVGAHGKKELVEGVARLIDGGTDAVKRRSGIYEGMIHR